MLVLVPTIQIIESENKISITGNSLPENPVIYYQPIFNYLNKIKLEATPKHLFVLIDVELFSSASLKIIVELFSTIYNLLHLNITHQINWYYTDENEDSFEKGEMAVAIIPVTITFIKK